MKSKIEEQLKHTQFDLNFAEKSLKSSLEGIVKSLENMTKEVKIYIDDNRYTLNDKTSRIIQLIHWGIANMHIEELTDKVGIHQGLFKQCRTLTELLDFEDN